MSRPMLSAQLHVVTTRQLTPHMRRITLAGPAGFTSIAPDQQIKLFFPRDGHPPTVPEPEPDGDVMRWYGRFMAMPETVRPWMRTYSVRRHLTDPDRLDVDFVLHGSAAGPASRWAASAGPGDVVGMVGPAVSHFRSPGAHDRRLFVGDETALPAIAAWLDALPAGTQAAVFAEVRDAAEEQPFDSAADVEVRWLHRGDTSVGRSTLLVDAVRAATLPDGSLFAWVAGEASAVRAVRRHLVGERGLDRRSVAFAGYWRLHLAQDDDPTAEDAADAAEITEELTAARTDARLE